MQNITNFKQAKDVLYTYIPQPPEVTRYNLSGITKLASYLDNPQDKVKVIHVAGTSGKTSTVYYIAALLHNAGYKVGYTVSPHVDEINERAQINMSPLPELEYCSELYKFMILIEKINPKPSYFEVLIAFAYWLFEKRRVDYAIVEVGLGGLLDGTNIVNRRDKVCVITDIGLDHTKILGETLSDIAYQKSGIIKSGNRVFMYAQGQDVMRVVKNQCIKNNATLNAISDNCEFKNEFVELPLFQRRNLRLAQQVVNYVLKRDYDRRLSSQEIIASSKVYIPARMETIDYKHKTLILDGSHNEQKIGALVDAVKEKYNHTTITLLVSMGENKRSSVSSCLQILHTISDDIILTAFDLGQDTMRAAIEPSELAVIAKKVGFKKVIIEPDPLKAIKLLTDKISDLGIVTGSFYLMDNVRPIVMAHS